MDFSVKIIYEDNHLLVVEKPQNMPVQKDKSNDIDLLTALKEDIKKKYQKPGNVYLGLVHRLDRTVGGVMVFAKTSKAASRLSEQIRSRGFQKTYFSVVNGVLKNSKGTFRHFLYKDCNENIVYSVSSTNKQSKEAILEYEVLGAANNYSLVKINLITGRSHQIRVQFSTEGHPLYGDKKYQKGNKKEGQIALWSNEIRIIHPTTRELMSFKSNMPLEEPWSWFPTLQ